MVFLHHSPHIRKRMPSGLSEVRIVDLDFQGHCFGINVQAHYTILNTIGSSIQLLVLYHIHVSFNFSLKT